MSVSCNAEFSDSKVIAVIAKRASAEKKRPKTLSFSHTRFYLSQNTLLFLGKTRCCFSQKCEPVAILLQPIGSSTAHHPQYYCEGSAVI